MTVHIQTLTSTNLFQSIMDPNKPLITPSVTINCSSISKMSAKTKTPLITPSPTETSNVCTICEKTYKTPATLRIHVNKQHQVSALEEIKANENNLEEEKNEDTDTEEDEEEEMQCGQGDPCSQEDNTNNELSDVDQTLDFGIGLQNMSVNTSVITETTDTIVTDVITTSNNSTSTSNHNNVTKCAGCHLNEVKLDNIEKIVIQIQQHLLGLGVINKTSEPEIVDASHKKCEDTVD